MNPRIFLPHKSKSLLPSQSSPLLCLLEGKQSSPFIVNKCHQTSDSCFLSLPRSESFFHPLRRKVGSTRKWAEKALDSVEPNGDEEDISSTQLVSQNGIDIIKILQRANSIIPQIVFASTVLALVYPASFTWFTNRYYAPALGFLMFAVGVNSSVEDFVKAISRPGVLFAGYVGQVVIKPVLGFFFGTIAVTAFDLPTSIGAGIMLVSCVSGAQLSNYATFLTDPPLAPLSIVLTALSTATAVFVTPTLSLLLIGQRLPVDVKGMMFSIIQIVVAPIAAGLFLNRFLPRLCSAIRPFLPPLSVFVTALCVGAPLAINRQAVLSPFGISILFLVIGFHLSAFVAGYFLTGLLFHEETDVKSLQRTLSFETGMQSSLLALALANKFFQDSLVGIPPAISVVTMSLIGFSLVMLWANRKERVIRESCKQKLYKFYNQDALFKVGSGWTRLTGVAKYRSFAAAQ